MGNPPSTPRFGQAQSRSWPATGIERGTRGRSVRVEVEAEVGFGDLAHSLREDCVERAELDLGMRRNRQHLVLGSSRVRRSLMWRPRWEWRTNPKPREIRIS